MPALLTIVIQNLECLLYAITATNMVTGLRSRGGRDQAEKPSAVRSCLDSAVLFAAKLGYYGWIMDISLNLILGTLAIAYGLYSFVQRKTAPEKIEKLQSMIERNGEKMAHSIHLFGYTILPIIAGLLLLFAHYRG